MRTAGSVLGLVLVALSAAAARADYLTQTWGNAKSCMHGGTAKLDGKVLSFDLSAVPAGAKVHRAVLRPGLKGGRYAEPILLRAVLAAPAGGGGEPKLGEPLVLRGPWFDRFDATPAVRRWLAGPNANLGLYVQSGPRIPVDQVVLEISFEGRGAKPLPAVTGLKAFHQAGQTFLTWREIEDLIGTDEPTFEGLHRAVFDARARRTIRYIVYRSDQPITAATLGQAELVTDVPEVIPLWNIQAVADTEHPNQGHPTMHSPLRGGNLVRGDIVRRYRIAEGAEPPPRGTGLAVVPAAAAGKRYYAVTAQVDGAETVAAVECAGPVDEAPSPFPATIFQRTIRPRNDPAGGKSITVDVYNSWLGPPYNNVPVEHETFIVRWPDLPEASTERPIPLWVVCGTYGSSSATMQEPGWYGARKHLTGAFTIGLADGGLWQGWHECIGTLKSYAQGAVHNYPQRRVLAAAAWGVWRKDFHLDPQRVYHWGQLSSWALRHGDVFAAVMSNGHGNLAIGKVPQQHSWKWGPGELGSDNWLGIPQWVYMDLPKWIRENPNVELPYWLCWPAYGAYPNHTVGDFGFMPWPETFAAMHATKRAFAAVWNSNGPGAIGELRGLITRIRRDQALPAFGNCNRDASPGDGDHADAQKTGGINLHQFWEPETIVDEPGRFEITLYLANKCPADECITDLTPRRCRKFKPAPGDKFTWTLAALADDGTPAAGPRQSGAATADQWGLVTVEKLRIPANAKVRLTIRRPG